MLEQAITGHERMGGDSSSDASDLIHKMIAFQSEAASRLLEQVLPDGGVTFPDIKDMAEWTDVAHRLQTMWLAFQQEQALAVQSGGPPLGGLGGISPLPFDPGKWADFAQDWYRQMPLAHPETQEKLWADGLALWENVLGQYGMGAKAARAVGLPSLPRMDPRFKDPRWSAKPIFALIHQTYLMLAEQIEAMVESIEDLKEDKREQLRFATRVLLEALSPAHFPLTNPMVLERTLETKGQNLVKGMEHLIRDLKRGQLSHTDPDAFRLGETIAATPGKVVHETPLYQLIQYSPTTDQVLQTPLVIFPPWINRFYILDLSAKKSFVRWAVDQGLTVFITSWKSADASMADIAWDDYIRAQIDAIDTVRERLKVRSVHAIGYCAAGTTLAATLAILARRGQADKVASATFFTAQVDFEKAGELKLFCDENGLKLVDQLSQGGYLDGRYMAATFNLLRGRELIWNYVINNYLMGEDYPAFDLLYWNGDTTNLPARWHRDYLRDLYQHNRLVIPDALSADGTPIDLTRIETPAYIQAGREDHIAPAESVFRMTHHLRGPIRFVLAGSGHIAGVVNPPAAKKYQYWTNGAEAHSLAEFVEGAKEHPGSWWPDWIEWIRAQGAAKVDTKGKRKPGGAKDKVIEDAPGRYVKIR